jgi:hypothetical protein
MMAYDAKDGYVLLFSGNTQYPQFPDDSWKFSGVEGAGGIWIQLIPATSPCARERGMMAYDWTAGYVLLFGGLGGTGCTATAPDTWEFSGGLWTEVVIGS